MFESGNGTTGSSKSDSVCVCVKTPRNTVLTLPNLPWWKQMTTTVFRFIATLIFPISMSTEFESFSIFRFQYYKFRGAFHLSEWMPNEEALIRCWYPGWSPGRTCQVELLTSCYPSVFLQFSTTFRFQSDEVWWSFDLGPSPFDEFRFIFFGFWTLLWRTYELRFPPGPSTTLGPSSK